MVGLVSFLVALSFSLVRAGAVPPSQRLEHLAFQTVAALVADCLIVGVSAYSGWWHFVRRRGGVAL
jgi:hypothetical protein